MNGEKEKERMDGEDKIDKYKTSACHGKERGEQRERDRIERIQISNNTKTLRNRVKWRKKRMKAISNKIHFN